MRLVLKPGALWQRLRSTYWFVPSLMTLGSVALGMTLVGIDRRFPDAAAWLGWAYEGGADGARALLSAVAGSTITVVSVTFSVTVVALTVSSQHFGPRLLNNFMRDTAAQLVLGAFIGTFTYCLVVLRAVQGEGDGYELFVPHLATTAAVVLTLLSVGALIFYIHHVSVSMQVSEIALAVSNDLESAIRRLYPDRLGTDLEGGGAKVPRVPQDSVPIRSTQSGYIQAVDSRAILKAAGEHDVVIWLVARPGDFVMEGASLALASPAQNRSEVLARVVQDAYVVGPDRTSEQDAGFAVQQLVEVALRALSPGTNEPFTAVTCIDRLGQGLAQLACRTIPNAERADDEGRLRVVAEPRTFAELLAAAFKPIIRAAADQPVVTDRLLSTLMRLAEVARRPSDARALAEMADEILRVSRLTQADPARHRVEDACRSLRAAADLPDDPTGSARGEQVKPTPA